MPTASASSASSSAASISACASASATASCVSSAPAPGAALPPCRARALSVPTARMAGAGPAAGLYSSREPRKSVQCVAEGRAVARRRRLVHQRLGRRDPHREIALPREQGRPPVTQRPSPRPGHTAPISATRSIRQLREECVRATRGPAPKPAHARARRRAPGRGPRLGVTEQQRVRVVAFRQRGLRQRRRDRRLHLIAPRGDLRRARRARAVPAQRAQPRHGRLQRRRVARRRRLVHRRLCRRDLLLPRLLRPPPRPRV